MSTKTSRTTENEEKKKSKNNNNKATTNIHQTQKNTKHNRKITNKNNNKTPHTWYLFFELKGILKRLGLAARYSSMSRKAWTNLIMAISDALPTAFHATTCGKKKKGQQTRDKTAVSSVRHIHKTVRDTQFGVRHLLWNTTMLTRSNGSYISLAAAASLLECNKTNNIYCFSIHAMV